MNLRNTITFSCLFIAASHIAAQPAQQVPLGPSFTPPEVKLEKLPDGFDASEHSRHWPHKVTITDPQKLTTVDGLNSEKVRKGRNVVVLRVETNEVLAVDFGDLGTHRIPVEATDLREKMMSSEELKQSKSFPNMFTMIGPRLIDANQEQPLPARADRISSAHYYLMIYVEVGSTDFEALSAVFDQHPKVREEAGVGQQLLPIFVQQDNPNVIDFQKTLKDAGLAYLFFIDFLARPFTKSLYHEPTVFPYIVLTDANGKILYRHDDSLDAVDNLGAALQVFLAHSKVDA